MTEGQWREATAHCPLEWLAHSLLDLEQFDLEQEGGVGGDDATCAAAAVPKIGGNQQLALAANLHAQDAFVPTLDHPTGADREIKRFATVHRAVELLTLGSVFPEPTCVVHDAGLPFLGLLAGAFLDVAVLQTALGLGHLLFLLGLARIVGAAPGCRDQGNHRCQSGNETPARRGGPGANCGLDLAYLQFAAPCQFPREISERSLRLVGRRFMLPAFDVTPVTVPQAAAARECPSSSTGPRLAVPSEIGIEHEFRMSSVFLPIVSIVSLCRSIPLRRLRLTATSRICSGASEWWGFRGDRHWHDAQSEVSAGARAGPGGHGGGLLGDRPGLAAQRRDQVAQGAERRGGRQALAYRGPDRRPAAARQRGSYLRLRPGRGDLVPGHGAGRWNQLCQAMEGTDTGRAAANPGPGGRGSGLRAPPGCHPPRHQTGQRALDRDGRSQALGLRSVAAGRAG